MNKIVVNATALRSGGALTILRQFIDAIPEDCYDYIVFIDQSVKIKNGKKNLQIIPLHVTSFYKRFKWDVLGLKSWLRKNKIRPLAAVSLQNTNFRINVSCPNYIYFHQSIPLYPYKWNFFKPKERILWFYKNIYPFFIRFLINSKTEIFVQMNFIKEEFSNRFNFPANKIHVVFPKIDIPSIEDIYKIPIDKNKLNLFYPATGFIYKNHGLLSKSLLSIDKHLTQKIVLFLTIDEKDFETKVNLINVEIVFLGQLSYKEVLWMFSVIDALVFPSYIETLGLPLIEAASFGLPIIVSDLPYAREVLQGYKGVTFVNFKDVDTWGKEIIRLCSKKGKKFESYKKEDNNSWFEFFNIIKANLS